MNKKAVLHIPMSQYAFALDEERMVFRIRTARGDLDSCRLYYGDRSCRQTPVLFASLPMEAAARDELFDYYEAELVSPYRRLCYYFELTAGEERVLYYGDFFTDHCVEDRSEYYQFPYMHRADLVSPPGWAQDAVIYNVFPDSFATGEGYISGRESQKEFRGKTVRAINVPGCASRSKSFFENMLKFATDIGMKGLGYVKAVSYTHLTLPTSPYV